MASETNNIVKRCSASCTLEELLRVLNNANTGSDVLQAFDPKRVINRMHLVGAFLNAVHAFDAKSNVANTVAMEMLLFASMDRQISAAIKEVGAKSSKDFILFANTSESYSKIEKLLEKAEDFSPTDEEQQKTAKAYGIPQKEELDKFVLQRMAVSRIEE